MCFGPRCLCVAWKPRCLCILGLGVCACVWPVHLCMWVARPRHSCVLGLAGVWSLHGGLGTCGFWALAAATHLRMCDSRCFLKYVLTTSVVMELSRMALETISQSDIGMIFFLSPRVIRLHHSTNSLDGRQISGSFLDPQVSWKWRH